MKVTFLFSVNEVSIDGPRQQSGCLFIAARRHKKLLFVASHYLRVVLVVFALLFLTFLCTCSLTLERGMNVIMFMMQILFSKSPVPIVNYVRENCILSMQQLIWNAEKNKHIQY